MRAGLISSLLSLSLLCVVASPAIAADPPGADAPSTWQMSLPQLRAIGLGQVRADPVPVPADAPRHNLPGERAPTAPQPGGAPAGTIFVNFDGAQLSAGSDNSINNVTQIQALVGSFAPYGQGAKREAVMQAVRADWAAFSVAITDQRPASGNYTMNMTGPTNPYGNGVLGIAPLDCNDEQTHNNITYAFHSDNDGFSATVTATTIGQEVAHSYGLEHVDDPGDIMNPLNAGGDASFTDRCVQVVNGGSCGSQHAAQCGSPSAQNSYQELMSLFGPAPPDTALPTVQIVSPSDGDTFMKGAGFAINVEADDNIGVQAISLFNNGELVETDAEAPWGWEVANVPSGVYEFYAEASDPAGNVAESNVVTVVVSDPNQRGDDDGADDDGGNQAGEDGGGGDSGGDAGNPDDDDGSGDGREALPDQFGQDGNGTEPGCACSTRGVGPDGPPARWLLGLAFVAGIQRRKAR